MRAYLLILKIEGMKILQYRAQILAGVFTQFVFGFMRIFVMVSFFNDTTTIQPMTLSQVVTYIWMTQMFLTLVAWRPDPETGVLIETGGLAYEMIRPLRLSYAWLMRSLGRRGVMPIMRGLPLLCITYFLPEPYNFIVPISLNRFLLTILVLITSWLLAGALNNTLNILAVYMMSVSGLTALFPIIMIFFSGLILPIPLFPDFLQKTFFYSPFIGLLDTPARVIMGHHNVEMSLKSIGVQIIWMLILTLLNDFLLQTKLKNVTIQGG